MNKIKVKNLFGKFFTTGMNNKKIAKFSSIFITTFLFVFSFANFAYADPTFTVNTTTVGQIDFIGSNVDGVSGIIISITKKSDGIVTNSGTTPIGVVSGFFSYTFDSVTPGQEYDYSIDGDGTILKTGTVQTAFIGPSQEPTTTPTTVPITVPTTTPTTVPTTVPTTTPTTTPTSGSEQQIFLENPLKNIDSIGKLVEVILRLIWKIGVWILALFIIYTGFLFVSARGNPAKIKEAGEALKYTLIGGAILLGAWVIAEAIIGTVNALK